MQPEFVVTQKKGLQRVNPRPPYQKAVATVLSYFFHPVFIPVYISYFFLFTEPFLFLGAGKQEKILMFIQALLMYTFFPLVSVLLLRALKFISSITLRERKDRIVPFIICNIWYFWIWYVWRNLSFVPDAMAVFAMGVFLASSIGLLLNIYMKISMHGIALGVAAAFFCHVSFFYGVNLGFYIALTLLITGLVGSSRLVLQDHTPAELYTGVLAGALGLLLATFFQ